MKDRMNLEEISATAETKLLLNIQCKQYDTMHPERKFTLHLEEGYMIQNQDRLNPEFEKYLDIKLYTCGECKLTYCYDDEQLADMQEIFLD